MKKLNWVLLLIILVSSFLRFYQIDQNPKALYGDSLTLVYDAYSILKTGHDQKGETFPIVFSLGGARPAGYVYATIPFVALFGPTALSSRMVSVLSGIGIVLLLYFLGKRFFSSEVGLAIAFMAALNPWELSLSRGPFETHLALFLTLLGFFAFLKAWKKPIWFIVFGLSFALAGQTYSIYRLIIPLFTILLFIFWHKDFKLLSFFNKPLLISLLLILASTILGFYLTFTRGDNDRFVGLNLIRNQALRSELSTKVKSELSFDSLNPSLASKIHDPKIELAGVIAENYVSNFFPQFLFLKGDGEPRHNPALMGEFYWIDFFLLIIGIIYLFRFNKKLLMFFLAWILIAPLGTSIVGMPHALRSSFLLPPLLILIGLGLWRTFSLRQFGFNGIFATILLGLFTFQFFLFIDKFYFVAPKQNVRFWSYSAKEASLLALMNKEKFDFIILSNDIDNMEFAYPVYGTLDPKLVILQNQNPTKIGEHKFFKYGNVYIGSLPHGRIIQFIKDLPGTVLYIGSYKEQAYMENYTILRGFDWLPELIVTAKGNTPNLELHPKE